MPDEIQRAPSLRALARTPWSAVEPVLPVSRLASVMRVGEDHDARVGDVVEHAVGENAHAHTAHLRRILPAGEDGRGERPVEHVLKGIVNSVVEVVAQSGLFVVVPVGCVAEFFARLKDARACSSSLATGCQLGAQLGVRLVRVQQLDPAPLDLVNATSQLGAPSRVDLALINVRVLGIKAAQATLNHGGTVAPIKGEQRLLDFRDVHGHATGVRRSKGPAQARQHRSPRARSRGPCRRAW